MSLARHLMVDFNQMKAFVDDPLILERGSGIRVTDTRGRTYIDGLSGVFTSNLGHANEEIIAAVTAQLGRLAFGAPTMATTSSALALVERILELVPQPFTTMKFLSGGSEATESAIKLARQFHRQRGAVGRYKVLSHYRGYHGGTGHALAASGWAGWKVPFEPMAAGFVHLHTPDPDDPPFSASDPEAAARTYLELVRETIELEGPESVAAVITEPILMSAGVVVPPDAYLRGLRDLCDRHGILLIFDEIITGFGRTGTWFAAQHAGAWPDILCCGKGVTGGYSPLSIVLMTDRVAEAFWGEPEDRVQFWSGHTYGGNPVACAAALAAIDYIVGHGVLGHVAESGSRLRGHLDDVRMRHPGIAVVRGRGLLQAIVFSNAAQAGIADHRGFGGAVATAARARGLLLRASPWFVALGPPLVTTPGELDEIVGILDEAVADVEAMAGGTS
ncbi:MAG: aminotransferase class III-fold pyridoxal phosphate-dependent enzyme [Chloroflexi bacterium]|nr:aminotransferase class III-fold pyridoxal phosphate-dependent enzyme [Chloroflexota bacterium]